MDTAKHCQDRKFRTAVAAFNVSLSSCITYIFHLFLNLYPFILLSYSSRKTLTAQNGHSYARLRYSLRKKKGSLHLHCINLSSITVEFGT